MERYWLLPALIQAGYHSILSAPAWSLRGAGEEGEGGGGRRKDGKSKSERECVRMCKNVRGMYLCFFLYFIY